jgi:hypothetical protein
MTVHTQQRSSLIRPEADNHCTPYVTEPPADLMQRLLDAAKSRKRAGQHVLRQDRLVLSEPVMSSDTNAKFLTVSTPSTSRSTTASSVDFFGAERNHTSIDHTRLAKRLNNNQLLSANSSACSTSTSPLSTAHSSCYFSCSSVL